MAEKQSREPKVINKELRVTNAKRLIEITTGSGFQGNIQFPVRDGEVGTAKLEQFINLEKGFDLVVIKSGG